MYKIEGEKIIRTNAPIPRTHYTAFGQIRFRDKVHFLLTTSQFFAPHPVHIEKIIVFPKNDDIRQALIRVRNLLYMVESSPYQRFNRDPLLVLQPTVIGCFRYEDGYSVSAILVSPLLTRFQRGLIDGIPANYVETVIEKDGRRYTITKGSVPFEFTQQLTWKYTPDIQFPDVPHIVLRDGEQPISLLNNRNANQKRLNAIFAE